MNNRVLITYATRAGSTGEVANAIGHVLSAHGLSVDVRTINSQPRLDGYQAVLIGSAIRMGSWLPEAVRFIEHNRLALQRLPLGLFTVHGINLGDDEQSRQKREAYLDAIRPYVGRPEHAFFAGKIDPAGLSLIDRLMVRMVKAPVGDFRDWASIEGWAQTAIRDATSQYNIERVFAG